MKTIKSALACMLMLCVTFMFAQDNEPTMFVVHVDNVNYNKMAQYEQLAKELKENCEKHNVQGLNWTTVSTEDARYYYVSPIKNMAELDENPMSELFEKMGEEKAGAMFEKMDECYDSHSNSVIHYLPKLSYNPEGYSIKDKNYREYHFLYYSPKNGKAVGESMKKVKKMFEDKGIKNGYSVYHSGFGDDESYFMIAVAGEDALDIATTGKENDKLLGEEGNATFFELIQLASRYDQVDGSIRPDLSYYPTKE